ncbi:mammalian cell entry protein [Mycobacterium hodleri]|uniref:mammalian cell entry protein n=1 Tax=Mycolicibacterium hodleri TaxID=49897 RepID=UPI0021F37D48|nr:mammalian cell entry protein [Mycolicibacterium hodleri]MCV7134201.1 mammalian cell entry protein [Mycolicibacterium hodleri]
MEDQSADSSDLTADAAAASVPQGKAARNRHRLPRQKAPQVEQADEATEVPEPAEVTEPAEVAEPAEGAAEEAVEADAVVPAEPPRRRRSLWKRGKTDPVVEPAPEAPEAPEAPDAPEAPEAVETSEPANLEDEGAEAPVEQPEEPKEVVLVPHRTAGRALKLVAVAAGVLFIAACAFAGATIQPYLADRAAVHTKFVIAETAANAITTLWTYTPDDMDKLPDRSARYLGGDFAADYKRYIDAIVEPNKQAQVTNNTQVLGAAVESLTPTEATAIVYTNSVATSPVTKGIPSLRYLSYRLTMKPQDNKWLITQMVAVTKLDLTPRL